MRSSIVYFLTLTSLALSAAAGEQKVMMFQESANGESRTEMQIDSESGSIVAGCRTSTKSKDYDAYWIKSEKNGSRICVEKSKRNDVTRGHYLQESADGSSLVASYESTPEKPDRVHFLMRGGSGDRRQICGAEEGVLLRRIRNLDHEMSIYMRGIQKTLQGGSVIYKDWDALR